MAPPYAGTVVVPIEPYSDGDPTHCPTRAEYRLQDPPAIYLEKLAESWMKERGEFHKGKATPACRSYFAQTARQPDDELMIMADHVQALHTLWTDCHMVTLSGAGLGRTSLNTSTNGRMAIRRGRLLIPPIDSFPISSIS